ncbi:PIG-L family deacetylase, partial [Marimonas arenosa]
MPIFGTGGAMTIVAHQDDDILFMNPDILHSIEAGVSNTTIYVTAGDSGLDEAYWSAREEGAKAAYLLMAGGGTWVDETITLEINGQTFEIASSYLAENPGIRLYFLRLPDGGGMLEPEEYEQLARLESGDLGNVASIDGANVYARDDLVNVLTELMELHAPTEFRLQVADGGYAGGEHTDHVHATEFALEALAGYSGESYAVTQYVQYQSGTMPANLSDEDAARALEIMQAYAEHDLAVLDETGQLAQVYVDWTGRQYVAEQYTVDTVGEPTDPTDPTEPVDPGTPTDPSAGSMVYSLAGPDAFLFTVDAT